MNYQKRTGEGVESSLYQFFMRNVHPIWGVMDTQENCKIVWDWYRSHFTSTLSHPMITVVHAQLALAAHYKGDEIWVNYYSQLAREESDPASLQFETFIGLAHLVEEPP